MESHPEGKNQVHQKERREKKPKESVNILEPKTKSQAQEGKGIEKGKDPAWFLPVKREGVKGEVTLPSAQGPEVGQTDE